MKLFRIAILVLCLTSCDYFDKKKVSSKDIIDEELKTFNWNEVDVYPSFESCNSASTDNERKLCFQNTLVNHITTFLNEKIVVVTQEVSDTIKLTMLISEKGDITIQHIESDSLTQVQIPDINRLLSESVNELPEILPAIKRGQQVKTQFELPIHIVVE